RLVVEDASVAEVSSDVARRERVAKEKGVSRVLVVNGAGERDVADSAVERRCLSHDVNTADLPGGETDPRQQMVGGHPERIIDVHDGRVARLQLLDPGHV